MTPTDDPIEPLGHCADMVPVRTAEELRRRWRSLLGPGGFGGHSLWVLWFDSEGRQLPLIVPVDELPDELDERLVWNLMQIVAETLELAPGGSVALCLTRPGDPAVSGRDRSRGRALLRAGAVADVRLAPLHLATPNRVRPLTADDLV